jgi:hypothetical protein
MKTRNTILRSILSLFIIISMLPIAALTANAETGEITVDGIQYWYDTSEMEADVVEYEGSDVDLTIPSTVTVNGTDCSVTSIGNGAFQSCSSLASVTIPDSVTSIEYNAFFDCTYLTSVTIPSSVTSIGNTAFQFCTSLISVTIPDSVTSIGREAFNDCDSLTGILVAEDNPSYTSEDGVLFSKDKKTLITCPDGKRSDSYTVPSTVTNIMSRAFDYHSPSVITIPSSVKNIDNDAFYFCKTKTMIIESKDISIGHEAFAASRLESLYFTGTKDEWSGVSKGNNWCRSSKLGNDPAVKQVTLKVANGKWDDGTTADKVITVVGNNANKLIEQVIPAVGNKPDENYGEGSWNADPLSAELTGDTTFTYTYEKSKTVVTITANDQTYTYNGKIQGPGDAAFEDPNDINRMVKVEGLSEGDKLECIQVDGQSDTADSKTYSAVLVPNAAVIKRDGKDVTNQYDIRYVNGSIIIEPAKVTLTSESGEKEYDGTPLTDSTVTVTGDGFAKGEGATYNVTGSQTKVGGEDGNNTFTYTLNEGTKASNYDIRTVCGTLTVKANATEIKITSADGEQDYSGSEFHKAEYVVKYGDKTVDASADGTFTLPTGDKLTVTDTSKVKEVSDTADGNNEFTYVLENSDQYSSVSVVFGKLTVKKAGAPVLTDANKPKANDLTENGSDQALITVPETVPEGYTVEYSTDGQNWSTDIPTGKDSGEYSVQVRYVGDDNHESFDGEAVTVKIKAVYTLIWLDAEGNELDKKTYVEGEDVPSTDKKPTKAEDADNTYTFDKWDEGTVDGKTTTYRPTFTATKKENPATGDGDAIFIWLAFTAVSGAVLAIAYRKKRTAVR